MPFLAAGSHAVLKVEFWLANGPMLGRGIPSALTQAMPGTAAFDMAAASLPLGSAGASRSCGELVEPRMSAMPGFDASAWAGQGPGVPTEHRPVVHFRFS